MHITDLNFISSTGTGVYRHHHTEEHEFHFIIRGSGTFTNQGRDLPMHDGSLFYSSPFQVHTAHKDNPGDVMTFYFIRFLPGQEEKNLMENVATLYNDKGSVIAGTGTHLFFEKVKMDLDTGDLHLRAAATLRFVAFIHELCAGRTIGREDYLNPHVRAAVWQLQHTIHERFSLDRLARTIGLEKSYLIRLFKKEVGTTPQQYLMNLRIDSAKYLLRHTDRPVNRIAEELGFYDEFYFSRVFKKMTGMAPTRFRK